MFQQVTDDSILFEHNSIKKFSDEWELFSNEQLELIFCAADGINSDNEQRNLCKKLIVSISDETDISDLKPTDDKSLFSEFCMLFPALYIMRESVSKMLKRGIPRDIIKKSIQPISLYMEQNEDLKGQRGFSAFYYWLPLYAMGKLFRISGFEFERTSYKNKAVIGVHIPPKTDISEKNAVTAFKNALAFFEKYYEEKISGFVCNSWLMNPEIERLMGKKTAISRFGDLFERSYTDNNDGEVYRFLFGCGTPCHPEKFCENTSLQRVIKQYILSGNNLSSYCGFICLQRFYELAEQYI